MAYASNILPKDAVYYQLTNASINNGILSLGQNGSATITVDNTLLTSVPASILFNTCALSDMPTYQPAAEIELNIVMKDGTYHNTVLYHTGPANEILAMPVGFDEGAYSTFKLTIRSAVSCTFILWEMCPLQEADVTTIIEGVEQSLPKLLSDYNSSAIAVGQSQNSVSLISCNLLANTDLQGHFLINFTASEYCNVIIRILDNEMTELFCPLTYTVQPGLNSIGIPHAFLGRLAGYHLFVVTVQCTNGTLAIPIRGILFTIDGGYLADRLINAGIDAMDLALHQPDVNGPDEIWLVGVDANTTTLRSRNYNAESGIGWTPRHAFDNSIWSAIEFDGDWVERNDTSYTIVTEDWPIVALVTTDGDLEIHVYDDEALTYVTQAVLDTDVVSVSMCRGYSSMQYVEQDQGVVCAYVKSDGTAWYTHYVYNSTAGKTLWMPSEQLGTDTNVERVTVNRLNDYRVGILCSNQDCNKWYVSSRTYVGQSVRGEMTDVSIGMKDTLFYAGPPVEINQSATPLVLPESIEVAPQQLYGTYAGPIVFNDDVDQHSCFTVYLNGTQYNDFLVYQNGNDIGVDLNRSMTGVRTIRVVFNVPAKKAIIDMTGTGFGWWPNSYDFTWNPVVIVRQSYSDSTSITVNAQASVIYRPMLTYNEKYRENIAVNVNHNLGVSYHAISDTRNKPIENVALTVQHGIAVAQIQTGETPV